MKITPYNKYKIKLELILLNNKIKCLYCSKYIKKRNDLTIDHVYPRDLGGGDNSDNLTISCKDCNLNKKNLLLTDYLKKYNVQITPMIDKFL